MNNPLVLYKTDENDQLIKEFMNYFKGDRGCRPKSAIAYEAELKMFREYFPNRNLLTLKEADIRAWKQNLVAKGLAARSVNRKLSVIRSFYRYFVDAEAYEDVITKNPARNVSNVKIPDKEKVFFTRQQAEGLLTGVMQTAMFALRDYCIWLTFLTGALRVSEVVALNVSDVDFDRDILHIRDAKGGKDRIIGMPKRLRDALLTYLNREILHTEDGQRIDRKTAGRKFFAKGSSETIHGGAMFLTRDGNRFSDEGLTYLFKSYAKKLGIYQKGASLHTLRRTAATLMYSEGGVDVFTLQEILGHSKVETTRTYTKVDSARILAAGEKNPLSKQGVDVLMMEKMRYVKQMNTQRIRKKPTDGVRTKKVAK